MNQISFQDVYQTITQGGEFKRGQRAMTPDGREWVFAQAQGAIGKNFIAIPNTVTSVSTTISSAKDNQGRIVYINSASSSFTTGQFQDGIGLINAGTGSGQGFKIRTNSPTQITLYPETALTTALSTDSNMALKTMSQVIISAVTSKIQQTVGATQVSFAANDYGWLLTEGDGTVVAGEVLIIGSDFVSGAATAGEVLKGTTAKGGFDEQNLGIALVANSGADLGALVRFEIRG